jgi:hypothetical protein
MRRRTKIVKETKEMGLRTAWRNLSLMVAGTLILVSAGPGQGAGVPALPVISGPWQPLFQPAVAGRYINDHCLYQDPRGDWHLIGITGERPLFGQSEKWFAHGVTSSLAQPMTELPALFRNWPDSGLKWAPHAVWDGDTLHLFAGPGPIRHFISRDGYEFEFKGRVLEAGWRWQRDTMVLKAGGGWIMYATDRVDNKDVVSAWLSSDLDTWTPAGPVFTALRPAPVWAPFPNSACESPFVIARGRGYYLSLTLTNFPLNPDPRVYLNTLVFYSEDPLAFGTYAAGREDETAVLVARFSVHAPEYLEDEDGRWWITSCGWAGYPRPPGCEGGQACIAPLSWEPAKF